MDMEELDEELDEVEPVLDDVPDDEPAPDVPPVVELPPLVLPPPDAAPPPLLPEDVPDDVPDEEDVELVPVDAFVDDPEPPTVSPTELLTAVTVPLISAVRVVPARAFRSLATVTSSWETFAWSWAIVAELI